MSTAKEICEGVPRSLLDSPVSDIHLSDIALHITEWRELAPYLDLSEVEEKDIVDTYPNHPKLQRRDALRKWKESNGNKATYRRLVCILCSQGRAKTAQSLKELLIQTTTNTSIEQDLDKFHEYVKDCYLNLKHPSSLQWPFSSNQSYIELDLYDAPFGKDSYSLKAIALRSVFSDIDQGITRKVVLIEGIAGSGKTTLCWYICTEWAAGRLFEDVKVLIHISFIDTSIHSATKLADLIPHPSEETRKEVARVIADVRGKGICFLLDACDEAPVAFKGSFLFQFIAGTERKAMIPYASILLTSRPGLPHELASSVSRRVIIKGFKSLGNFVESTLQANDEKRVQLLEALNMKPELESLCHIPLHAVILVHLFDCFKDNLPTTRTGLFHPLVCNFLIRHVGTRTNHPLGKVFDLSTDLPHDVYTAFRCISELAYQSLISMCLEVPENVLKRAGMIPLWEEKFGFFRAHKRITVYGPTATYSYSHLSLQEFLAAFHITQLDECDQAVAFRRIYEQNPLCPALSFYAGLTGLKAKKVCNLLFYVVTKPFDLTATVIALMETGDICNDRRRQLLSLMNCIYETQQAALVNHVLLPPNYSYFQNEDRIVASSDYASRPGLKIACHVEIPLSFMMLYATDCLSVGYFVRHACSPKQKFDLLLLNLTSCLLRSLEVKALCQELCKPVHAHKFLLLNISLIPLKNDVLDSLKSVLASQPALFGLMIAGYTMENIQLALKCIIEGISSKQYCKYLTIIELNVPMPVAHHLTLLVYCCHLSTLELSGSRSLLGNPKVMNLFCEALKHCTGLQRLMLDSCGINDDLLVILAYALTSGCVVKILDVGWNPHTSKGLTDFLNILVSRVRFTLLLALAASTDINAEHHSLVEQFNCLRHWFYPYYGKLTVGCKNKVCPRTQMENDTEFFFKSPQYVIRSPHE